MQDLNHNDRRAAIARYVEYGEERVQDQFVAAAEAAYQRLLSADEYESRSQVVVRTLAQPAERRGLFRRGGGSGTTEVVMASTAAISRVAIVGAEVPSQVAANAGACAASARVARVLASVTIDLASDLLALTPDEQSIHPAYRQTLHLASELEATLEIVASVGCTDPLGCVGIRSPDHWGRRSEDVEIAEVQLVLRQLALAGKA